MIGNTGQYNESQQKNTEQVAKKTVISSIVYKIDPNFEFIQSEGSIGILDQNFEQSLRDDDLLAQKQFILGTILEALDQIFQLTTYVIRGRSMAEDDDQRGTKFFVSPSSLPLIMDFLLCGHISSFSPDHTEA